MTGVKLSQKERDEVVTKGYLEDVLDQRNFVNKDYFHNTLNLVLESKNYSTNDRLDMVIEEVASIKTQLSQMQIELGEDNRRHMSALMEDNRHQISLLIEAFEARFERIERKVFA